MHDDLIDINRLYQCFFMKGRRLCLWHRCFGSHWEADNVLCAECVSSRWISICGAKGSCSSDGESCLPVSGFTLNTVVGLLPADFLLAKP